MGLDKKRRGVFNGGQMKKLLLALLGLGAASGLETSRKSRVSPLTMERKRFEGEVRDQFLKLKEKGLGIRVFTL